LVRKMSLFFLSFIVKDDCLPRQALENKKMRKTSTLALVSQARG
jgi:hypothetical protein